MHKLKTNKNNIQEEVLILNLTEPAYDVESSLAEYFKPYPEGIYVRGTRCPLFRANQFYYREFDNRTPYRILEPKDISGVLYDQNGDMVIDTSQLSPDFLKAGLFSDSPGVPFRGFDFIVMLLKLIVQELLKERDYRPLDKVLILQQFFKEITPKSIEAYERALDSFVEYRSAVVEFMNRDYYKEYDFKIRGLTLKVVKGEDFRINEYYRLKALMRQRDDSSV